jgi:hypothetical protein
MPPEKRSTDILQRMRIMMALSRFAEVWGEEALLSRLKCRLCQNTDVYIESTDKDPKALVRYSES